MPYARAGEIRLESEIRRRVAERPATLVTGDDDPVQLERSPEHGRSRDDVSLPERDPDRRGRDARERRHHDDAVPHSLEQREIARAADAEAEVGACHDGLHADRAQVALGELVRRETLERRRERGDEDVLRARLAQELEATLERRQELHPVPERDPWVRIEGDHGDGQPRRAGSLEHRAVPAMDAVEAPDRHRARAASELRRVAHDLHASLPSATSASMIRSGSASSTWNGPISVRLSEMQWPPSASAIERTYVPEETWSSRRATPPS